MTKQEVRAAALAKLAVRPTDTLWDVGAGTGSVSVELALAAPAGRVCAVECDAEACDLIRQNRAKFAVQNLHLTEGFAPAALAGWPAPLFLSAAARAVCGLSSMPRWPRTPTHGSASAPLRWKPCRRPLRP